VAGYRKNIYTRSCERVGLTRSSRDVGNWSLSVLAQIGVDGLIVIAINVSCTSRYPSSAEVVNERDLAYEVLINS